MTAAGCADAQVVRGLQGLRVELHRRVLHTVQLVRQRLELPVVGGDHGARTALVQRLHHGPGQRTALRGVGARAHLVQEHKATRPGFPEDLHHRPHVGREGGQVLLDALLVPDVREHRTEHARPAVGVRGDGEAGLRHQGQQPHGLEGHGLAARVGAGDHQRPELLAKPHVHGDHAAPVAARALHEQRVARGPEVQEGLRHQPGLGGVEVLGQRRLREHEVQPAQDRRGALEVRGAGSHFARKLRQDPLHLLRFLGLQLAQAVPQLQNREGLHEEGGAGGRLVVHHARELGRVRLFHRHHVAVPAHGDDRILQHPRPAPRPHDLLEGRADAVLGRPHLPPHPRQARARGV
ncbi:hypothetical protein HRbin32_00357 [bacterium HR32]|nr:hypothetical protein HRbin32_00357 [bacterium HR32]